jgi:hypothetical protein
MLVRAERVVQAFPPVPPGRSPWMAYAVGLLFSGFGLGIYLRSWMDFVVPTTIWVVLIALLGEAGLWFGMLLGGTWGLLRVTGSP